jgi:hypothetical protein
MLPIKKTVVILIFVGVCLSANLWAARSIRGYYVQSPSGRKINATFHIPFGFFSGEPNYARMQKRIKGIDGADKYDLLPADVSEVSFVYNGTTYTMRSIYNTFADEAMFLHVIVDGPVILYNYYESSYSPGAYSASTGMSVGGGKQTTMRLVLQRNGGDLFKVRRLLFKKDLSEYFADCPVILDKINNSSVADLPAIVKMYNAQCQ